MTIEATGGGVIEFGKVLVFPKIRDEGVEILEELRDGHQEIACLSQDS